MIYEYGAGFSRKVEELLAVLLGCVSGGRFHRNDVFSHHMWNGCFLKFVVIVGHDHSLSCCGDRFLFVAHNNMFEYKTIITEVLKFRPDRECVWERDRSFETSRNGRDDGANSKVFQALFPTYAVEVLDASIFEVAKVNDIVDVLEGIHFSPSNDLCDYNWVSGQIRFNVRHGFVTIEKSKTLCFSETQRDLSFVVFL